MELENRTRGSRASPANGGLNRSSGSLIADTFVLRLAIKEQRLSPTIETTLYRVLQEAITNIARHAGATRVAVILETREKEVSMIVEDNGRGFRPDELVASSIPSKRLGLLGIRERLSLVLGTLEVESAPGKGCTLYIRVPL